jgi:hypothetical protein
MLRLRKGWMGIRILIIEYEPSYSMTHYGYRLEMCIIDFLNNILMNMYCSRIYLFLVSTKPPTSHSYLCRGFYKRTVRTSPLHLTPCTLPFLPPRNLARSPSHDRTRMNDTQYYQRKQHRQRVKTVLKCLVVRDRGLQTL